MTQNYSMMGNKNPMNIKFETVSDWLATQHRCSQNQNLMELFDSMEIHSHIQLRKLMQKLRHLPNVPPLTFISRLMEFYHRHKLLWINMVFPEFLSSWPVHPVSWPIFPSLCSSINLKNTAKHINICYYLNNTGKHIHICYFLNNKTTMGQYSTKVYFLWTVARATLCQKPSQ